MFTIGANIKAERARRGWTRNQLAAKSGVSAHAIEDIERGLNNPRVSTLIRIAQALDIEAQALLPQQPVAA